jgi:hypothetical protein
VARLVNHLAENREPIIVSITTGSPKGLRGSQDADDPMNLIRVMPAEGVVALPCGA